MSEKLDWLQDEPIQCGYFPTEERCENDTKMIAFGANDAGTWYWFPICTECALMNEAHSWQVAQPYGLHDADIDVT